MSPSSSPRRRGRPPPKACRAPGSGKGAEGREWRRRPAGRGSDASTAAGKPREAAVVPPDAGGRSEGVSGPRGPRGAAGPEPHAPRPALGSPEAKRGGGVGVGAGTGAALSVLGRRAQDPRRSQLTILVAGGVQLSRTAQALPSLVLVRPGPARLSLSVARSQGALLRNCGNYEQGVGTQRRLAGSSLLVPALAQRILNRRLSLELSGSMPFIHSLQG
ncbi:putative polyketide hydroxylase [Manis pentadactyla]|uniref:putative polyketide hydroxylase n=1 Tax=Manis pentadactyla TaxID=143292 RepID=UPI00255C457F|nr:putative polyketide hydroxylase [Manis pentadactyla]